ncbi:MAG: Rpn family recombination-promoting nuclease/putative transposase [Planctomycetaceae bacterium]|jgi:predicted transposase/invertase (TIGR01784 family)|nr:Rpn family recombination-promoting nuclease/putative transposase [Planctomycetaceae bacterium]
MTKFLSDVSAQVELAHPHDLIVRYFLKDTELFMSLLQYYCDNDVIRFMDFNSLKYESPTIIDNKLIEVIGDLLFSAQFKDKGHSKIFFFFEHQSKKVKRFCIRCLKKLSEFYDECETNPQDTMNNGKYPYAIVVVLYHGVVSWDQLLQMSDLVSLPSGADRNYLSFPTVLIDLSRIKRDDLKGHPALVALLDMLQSASEEKLLENFDRIVSYFEPIKTDKRVYGWVRSMTHYVLSLTQKSKKAVIKAISRIFNKKEIKKMIMSTLAKQFVKGEKVGIRKGIKKGVIKGVIKGEKVGVRKGVRKGKIDDIICILTRRIGEPSAKLKKQIEEVNEVNELNELVVFASTCVSLDEFATAFN